VRPARWPVPSRRPRRHRLDDLQQNTIAVEARDAHLQHVAGAHGRGQRRGDAPARDLQQVGQTVRRQDARRDHRVLDQQRAQRLRVGRELRQLGVDQRGQIRVAGDDRGERIDAHVRP